MLRTLIVNLDTSTIINVLHLAWWSHSIGKLDNYERLNCFNYAARALALEKSATTTLSVAFILCRSLITENSSRIRNLFPSNVLSKASTSPYLFFNVLVFVINIIIHFFYFSNYNFIYYFQLF